MFNDAGMWAALIAACLGTYLWRGLGVFLSGKISQDSEIFKWLSADLCHGGCINTQDYFVTCGSSKYGADLCALDRQYLGVDRDVFKARKKNGARIINGHLGASALCTSSQLLALI